MKLFRRISTSLLLITFSVLLLGATGDRARFNDLGHRMMCVCGCNQILLECNHVGCTYSDRMREQLSAAIQQESNDENILQTFVKEYGTTVLAAPTMRGFDRVAWIMPFAVFLAGGSFDSQLEIPPTAVRCTRRARSPGSLPRKGT